MANEEQLAILKQGVDVWNKWREENPNAEIDLSRVKLWKADLTKANLSRVKLWKADLTKANLSKVNFKGANLSNATFTRATLSGADLRETNLNGVDFIEANLSEANLNRANLRKATLRRADLREASLSEANLSGANLREANLNKAKLYGAKLGRTNLRDNDLHSCSGLKTVKHYSPSTVGMETIKKSKGKIPTEFLRGCGLSDLDIAYAKLARLGLDPEQVSQIIYEIHNIYLDQPIQFYSCFISYNNKDQEFAQRLHDDLQNSGVRCWFAPEDMKIGDRIRPTIDNQIRMREKLIVILSENSIQSEWVGDEVEAAIEQEKESGKIVLFPISLDNAVFDTRDDWAAMIKRRRSIGDFSKWKDEAEYQKMFDRLLRDLKALGEE